MKLHIRAPARVTRRVRRRFTHKGFQNFTSGHRRLIGMNTPDERAEAHAKFSAHAMEHVDEAQFALLSGLTAEILDAGGVGAELATKIAALASECHGELIYDFAIWKDNVTEVADRILQVLDRAMVDEFGVRWRDLKLLSATLFIHAYADLGHGDVSRFDLTPTLKRRSRVSYDLFLDGGEEQEDAGPIDTGRFESFTEELMAAHVTCEPEAFGCYEGGRGTTVRINGLQAKPELNGLSAKILGPVDLESGRWPVELLDGRRNLSVRGQNLVAGS